MYKKSKSTWTKHLDFCIIDLLSLLLSFTLAFLLRFKELSTALVSEEYRLIAISMMLFEFICAIVIGNYDNIISRGYLIELRKVFFVTASTFALTTMYMFTVHTSGIYSRILIYLTISIFLVIDYISRSLWKIFLRRRKKSLVKSEHGRSMLIVSDSKNAKNLILNIKNNSFDAIIIKGIVFVDDCSKKIVDSIPVVAKVDDVEDYICKNWVDEVLIYNPLKNSSLDNLIMACHEMGVVVHTVLELQNTINNKQIVEKIGNMTVVTSSCNFVAPHIAFIKRLGDIFGGIIGSIFAILIIIIIGPIIAFKSPGPILFKQVRIGKGGKPFTIYKLRSMYLDAEEKKKEYLSQNRNSDGMMFKLDFDPRIIGNRIDSEGNKKTGIGEFIRKTSIDEFPQFFNVLKGDMSLVGTRPPTKDEWEKYSYHHRARLSIKPGITGLWQVSGRSEITDFEEVVKLDTDYIYNFSIENDIKIIFKTLGVVLFHKGAM